MCKSKNTVQLFLAKSKVYIESSLESEFFIPKARLAFTKLRQAFINTSIYHYIEPECYI